MTLKILYRKGLMKIAHCSIGVKIESFFKGSAQILNEETGRKYRSDMRTRLAVSNVVSVTELDDNNHFKSSLNSEDKIKIRFFHCSESTFSVIQTVCESFRNDERFDLLIVLFGNSPYGMIKQMQDLKFKYVEDYNYDLSKDCPDISVLYHLEIIYPPQLAQIREFSKYVALVPLGIGSIWFGDRTVKRMNLQRYNADMCCVGNLCYNRLIDAIGRDKIERISPAQFDLVYRKFNSPVFYPKGWEKLKGKKTIMLMTDHGIRMHGVSDEVTFDLYFKTIMDYCKRHQDMGFIFRLHPSLIHELVGTFWSIKDYEIFVDFCKNSPNIVWDTTSDYLIGLHIADACMVDVNCSLIYFVLAANKPIGIPLRYDMDVEVNNPELVEKYYKLNSDEKVVEFFEMVRSSEDPKQSDRQQLFDKYIETFDGKNGYRIYNIMINRYMKLSLSPFNSTKYRK
ncbi:hypothetical protein [Bacteroides stercorirosoris]|jgi:hypothetical protein|uniref:CDP-Glycerol:Poly(Glycerophosphate) glycerophosphotransferase n=1 Tax=Bacteroides stercorirosoris TaxID=871324 RepID=A0A1M6AVM8_9BACE|nr:hypothetical protein [Bacteroides stercorirosoris]SHI40609.1 hypothetical protein SAMN05444350_10242 [Bacteroides stercorirosoris]